MDKKEGLINVEVAADYLGCSHQWIYKMLRAERDHPLFKCFRHYGGAWRTTYALLDEFFQNNGEVPHENKITSEE